MKEVWKDIPRYNGKYQASNLGRIRNRKGYILKLRKRWGDFVTACLNDKDVRIHRLIAETFIPNPDNLPYVLHKDNDKTNNRVENLCWSNPKRNGSLVGKQFGDFVAIAGPDRHYVKDGTWNNYYHCKCVFCGLEKEQRENLLKNGMGTKCSCQRNPEGFGKHFMYKRWQSMMNRCYNPNSRAWKRYGGRGIRVCEEWHSPKNYCEYWEKRIKKGSKLQIDRIDNNGDYYPENCRLADSLTQMNNRECVRKIRCIETGKIYLSTREAQRDTGIWSSNIWRVLKNKQNTAGGYHWEYLEE